jgi:Fe2+ or Zn2+ uptake regulation protein
MSSVKDKTLCTLQEEGFIESHTDEFKKLIQPAHFFCKNCGRSAVNEKNLCNPENLTKI